MRLIDATLGQLADHFGAPARVLATVSAHYERCVFNVVLPDGTPAIVKGNRDASQARAEVAALEAAGKAGVPVPAVIAYVSEAVSVLVLERLDGEWLSPDHPPSAWQAAGAALRKLHDVAVPGLRGFAGEDDWAAGLRRTVTYWTPRANAGGLAAEVIDCVRATVDGLVASQSNASQFGDTTVSAPAPVTAHGDRMAAPAPVTLHGDCMPIHVRLAGGQVVGLLDLGDACRGDSAWDMVTLTLRSPERLPAVLDGYRAGDVLRTWVDHAMSCYRALRLVAEVGWLADHGYDPSIAAQTATAAAADLASQRSGVSHLQYEG